MNVETHNQQQSEIKTLIIKGKEQGYLTYAEVNDHLPDDIVDPEQIEDIIGMINDMGIEVHEVAPDGDSILPETPVATDDETATEEAVAVLSAVDAEVGRTTDPVRMYMREMGTVELLTREGEIAIAKRIEEGLNQVQSSLANFPWSIQLLVEEYDQHVEGRKRLSELLTGFADIEVPGLGRSTPAHCSEAEVEGAAAAKDDDDEAWRTARKPAPGETGPDPGRSHAAHGRVAHAVWQVPEVGWRKSAPRTRRRRSCARRWPRRSSSSSCPSIMIDAIVRKLREVVSTIRGHERVIKWTCASSSRTCRARILYQGVPIERDATSSSPTR